MLALGVLSGLPVLVRSLQAAASRGRALFSFVTPPPRKPGFQLPGLSPEVTPTADFYVMGKASRDPRLAYDLWCLRIEGPSGRIADLSWKDLLKLPRVEAWCTMQCISNPIGGPLIGNGYWSGVRVIDLFDGFWEARARYSLVAAGADGYADGFPLDVAFASGGLVVYGLNGRTLTERHGAPARMLVPGYYGFKQVKWLAELKIVEGEYRGRWQELGWTKEAQVQTTSRVDTVQRLERGVVAAGIAYGGSRGIRRVDVRVNGGPWELAELHTPALATESWVQWRKEWPELREGALEEVGSLVTGSAKTATKQRLVVEVRAVDGNGNVQVEKEAPPYPDGATGLHRVEVVL